MNPNIERMERLASMAEEFDRLGLREAAADLDRALMKIAGRSEQSLHSIPGFDTLDTNLRETAAYQSLGGTQNGSGSAYFGPGADHPLDLSNRPANMTPEQYMQWLMQNGGNVAGHSQQNGYQYIQNLRSRYLANRGLVDMWGRPIGEDLYNASIQIPQGQTNGLYQPSPQAPPQWQPNLAQGGSQPGATNVPQYQQQQYPQYQQPYYPQQ